MPRFSKKDPTILSDNEIATKSAQFLIRRCNPNYTGKHPIALNTDAVSSAIPSLILEATAAKVGDYTMFHC